MPMKVKSLCVQHEGMYGVVELLHAFLSLVLNRNEWSASQTVRFNHDETDPHTNCTGDYVGPRTGTGVL